MMTRYFLIGVVIALLVTTPFINSVSASETSEEQIVNIGIKNKKDVARIADMGLDIAEVTDNHVTCVVRPWNIPVLRRAGFDFVPEKSMTRENLMRFRSSDAGKYHTWEETNAELKEMAKKYPKIARVEKIGKSFENRDVYALRISGAGSKKVPKALFMGLHHAREWISTEVPIYIARELLNNYEKDPKITKLVNNRVVYIVPVVNPDGLIWSQNEYSYWRKNRNDNNGHSRKGVDPNRNYGYKFGTTGASTYPGSDTYHGTGPFSEPCTQNIKKLAEREKFTTSLSYHSYSQLVLYPFGYGYNIPNPDEGTFKTLARELGRLTGYRPQNSADLYPAMGDSDDWLYGSMGVLSFTVELGRRFVPAENLIDSICEKNVKAALYLLEAIEDKHSTNHPDHVSAVKFRTTRTRFLAAQADILKNKEDNINQFKGILQELDHENDRLVYLMKPDNDPEGKKLEEFLRIISTYKTDRRAYFLPVLNEIKTLYLNYSSRPFISSSDILTRIDRMEEAVD
jgi:carboxypeptidase T